MYDDFCQSNLEIERLQRELLHEQQRQFEAKVGLCIYVRARPCVYACACACARRARLRRARLA